MKKITVILAIVMFIIMNGKEEDIIVIPNEAIRVRVVANSNDFEDQKVKETLKDDVKKMVYYLLKDAKNIEEARDILKTNIPNIKVEINKSLKKQNKPLDYNINYGLNLFTKKEYKNVEYKEGEYESLVITLGKGKGENWWCILFPPLCMIDEKMDNVEYKSIVKEILNKYIKNETF